MRVAHVGNILSQLIGQLAIIQETVLVVFVPEPLLPRAQMHFVNGHGLVQDVRVSVRLLVIGIAPLVAFEVADDGCVGGTLLASKPEGVGLVALYPIGAHYDETVGVA